MYRAVLVIACTGACTFQPPGVGSPPADVDGAPVTPPDARPDARPALGDAAVIVPPDAASPDAARTDVLCDFEGVVESASLTPELLANVNSSDLDRDPVVTADGRTLFLMSTRPGGRGEDIWRSTRTGRGQPFSPPQNVTELNSAQADTRVSLTEDQRLLVMTSARNGNFDVYITERDDDDDQFDEPELLAEVNSSGEDHDPVLSLDGLRLYLSAPGPVGGRDILMAKRDRRDDDFSTPQLVPVINTGGDEADPALTADELVIVFARNRDVFYATRPNVNQEFSTPEPLAAINTASEEADPFVTADGCEFFFVSDRAGGLGNLDLYRVRIGP